VTRIATAWHRFFFAPARGERIAAFRILFALYLLAYFGAMLPHVELLFSNQGVYVPYLVPDCAPPPALAWPLFLAMPLCAACLLVGYRSELSARVLFVLFLYHYFLQLAVKQSSFDRLIAIYLAVLCFADAGRVWGLDARRAAPVAQTVWAERLLAAQSIFLYAGSGLWKLLNPSWHHGALLRSNMQSMWATPFGFALVRLGFSEYTWTLFSWSIIVLELSLGVLLLVRRTRPLGIALGTAFHLGNCFVLVIPEFLVSVTPYPVFIEPRTLERLGKRVARLLPNRLRSRPAGAA
jgi:hypothetical protein